MEDSGIYELLARRVRAERLGGGLTLEQVAEKAGITPAYVAHIEAARKRATLATANRLARALGLSIAELLSDPASAAKISEGNAPYLTQMSQVLRGKSARQKNLLVNALKSASRLLD